MNCEKFTVDNVIEVCRNMETDDSYVVSPVYYLMTGRKGGMIFRDEQQSIIAINHPNIAECILIFPAISNKGRERDLTQEFAIARRIIQENSTKSVRLARIPITIAEKYEQTVEEEILDWKYPVHILDVEGILSLKGKAYKQIRQRINSVNREMCVLKELNINSDKACILDLARNWANEFPYNEYTHEDLIAPTEVLLELMEKEELNIHGQIIYYDGIVSSYCVWEERGQIANVFAMAANRRIVGLAEYNIVMMCHTLFNKSIKKVNVGGSESEGLNRYKRKFAPIQSIILKSCIVGEGYV